MAAFSITVVAIVLFGGALYLTRLQYRRAVEDRGEKLTDGTTPFVVTVDPETRKLTAMTHGLDIIRAEWHPIRFPYDWESRSAGLPAEKATYDVGFRGRRAWCEKHCQGRWCMENPTSPSLVFWFEDRRDAMAFSFAWYPFKCV